MLEIQGLNSILFFFSFLFLSVYSIFRTRARDQWDFTGNGHTVIWLHAMMKMVEHSEKNDIILCIIYIVVLKQTYGHLG